MLCSRLLVTREWVELPSLVVLRLIATDSFSLAAARQKTDWVPAPNFAFLSFGTQLHAELVETLAE
jgi:7-cyano-7-deazaguanine synthase in queuosine biosynthesis